MTTNTTNFNTSDKHLTVALDAYWMELTGNHVARPNATNMDGVPYVDPNISFDTLNDEIKDLLYSKLSKRAANTAYNELEELYYRDKGYFEPLRQHSLHLAILGRPAIKHSLVPWTLLYITYPAFRLVADFIGSSHQTRYTCSGIFNGLTEQQADTSVKEVKAVLDTMISLGGLVCVDGYYSISQLNFSDKDVRVAEEFFEYALTGINKRLVMLRENGVPLNFEYEVTPNSPILKGFFPFNSLFNVFAKNL